MTATGAEALLLEASMIKQHQPPFNVLLKDDKRNCKDHGKQKERSDRLFARTPLFPSLFLSIYTMISNKTQISLSRDADVAGGRTE